MAHFSYAMLRNHLNQHSPMSDMDVTWQFSGGGGGGGGDPRLLPVLIPVYQEVNMHI